MLAIARRTLAAGRATVLDAVFLKPEERVAAEALAASLGVPFAGIWLEGAPDLLRARLDARRGDASDADAAILAEQLGGDPGEITWRRIDAADPADVAARMVAHGAGD